MYVDDQITLITPQILGFTYIYVCLYVGDFTTLMKRLDGDQSGLVDYNVFKQWLLHPHRISRGNPNNPNNPHNPHNHYLYIISSCFFSYPSTLYCYVGKTGLSAAVIKARLKLKLAHKTYKQFKTALISLVSRENINSEGSEYVDAELNFGKLEDVKAVYMYIYYLYLITLSELPYSYSYDNPDNPDDVVDSTFF